MKVKRSQEEIVERIEALDALDRWEFLRKKYAYEDLVMFLDYEHAKPYLKEGTTKEKWEEIDPQMPKTDPIQEDNVKSDKEKIVYKEENHAVPFGCLLHEHIMNIAKQIMKWTYQWGYKFGYSDGKEGRPEDATFSMSRDAERELELLIDGTFYKAELIEMVRENDDG